MRTYIGIMPVSGEASGAAPQSISSGPPLRTAVSSAMTAKVGAAASDSQSAAPPSDVLLVDGPLVDGPLVDGPLVDGQARPGLSGPPSLFMQLIVAAMPFRRRSTTWRSSLPSAPARSGRGGAPRPW